MSTLTELFEEIKKKAREIYTQLSILGEENLKVKLNELANLLEEYLKMRKVEKDIVYALTPWGSIPVYGPSAIEALRKGKITPEVMVLLEVLAGV